MLSLLWSCLEHPKVWFCGFLIGYLAPSNLGGVTTALLGALNPVLGIVWGGITRLFASIKARITSSIK